MGGRTFGGRRGEAGERHAVGRGGLGRAVAALFLAVLAILAGVGCGPRAEPDDSMRDVGEVRAGALLAQGPAPGGPSAVELHRPTDMVLSGDSIWVVDNGNDRLVVLDGGLSVLATLGGEGEGPGEFQQPIAIRRSPAGVIAVDMGNSRFTELDPHGAVVRTFAAPPGLDGFGVSAQGAVLVPSRTGTHRIERIGGQGAAQLGAWPVPPPPDEMRSIQLGMRDTRIAVTAGDTIHVFDEPSATLSKYGPDGTLHLSRSIPATLRDSVRAALDELLGKLAKQGIGVLSASLSKSLSVTADGELLLLIAAGGTAGLIIDPQTYSARRLVLPGNAEWDGILLRAKAAQLGDSVLYVLEGVDVHAFRIEAKR